ncbi:CoA-disulfide reductase [Nocardioides sp. GY 10113]|uniref:FAD-dependent oxidoreductase n=1 Tax=Nocardioides sp. GY 10113 TaxID=2569761 RepID=UPI0010A901F9|nr:FAD-dependent oxidoreductase [Nocardioides sp. GY 10113]TIC89085.1 CoA-disulfide reductase [Nocardioides sp. GY 10113]
MRIVVVGGDAAGMSAAHTALRRARAAGRPVEVVVLEAGGDTSYSACGIPYWIAGEVGDGEELVARTAEEHRSAGIDLRLHTRATALDPVRRTVTATTADGAEEALRYDELVLATGAHPVHPDWAERDGEPIAGIHSVKTLVDGARWNELIAEAETAAAARGGHDHGAGPRAVVVGAGYLGIEMAEAFLRRGVATTLVTRSRVMSSLDEELGDRIAEDLAGAGVVLRSGVEIGEVVSEGGRVRAVVTTAGERLPADLVVPALGVEPTTALGRAAGLPLGENGGYLPDPGGRVAPGIWAAGDCCEYRHRITGQRAFVPLGTHANKTGRILGANLLGAGWQFGGVLGTAITRFAAGGEHLEVARTGLGTEQALEAGHDVASLVTEGTTASGYMPEAEPITIKVLADRSDRRLLGVQVVGGPGAGKRIDAAAAALWGGMTVDDLAWMDLSYAPPFATAWEVLQVAARRLAERL